VPELPDVEHLRRSLAARGTRRRIEEVVTTDPGILRNVTAEDLDRALRGHRMEEPERRGKWVIAWTTGPAFLLHFGMTGDLVWGDGPDGRHRHDRVIFALDRGELRYRNMRKLGGLWLAHDAEEVETILAPLGPDALSVDRRRFRDLMRVRRGQVKAALMDQGLIAGAGNLVVDEVLWHARIHPLTRLDALTDADVDRLHRQLDRVLRTWVDRHGDLPRGWLIVVRARPGAVCPRCGTPLERIVAGGRTTYFCPRCQPFVDSSR
jgi:formamidopyrimidine-DNA glycosylase